MISKNRFTAVFKAFLCLGIWFLVLPKTAWAKDAVLIFWMDDSDSNSIFKGALSERNFNLRCARLEDQFPGVDLYPVMTTEATDGLKKVREILAEHITVTHLIVATHGSYQAEQNQTKLVNLGGFSSEGPTGLFKELLELLGQRHNLGNSLHIYFDSCSNFRGSVADLKMRAHAVASFTEKLGVQKTSMWGANRFLWSTEYSSANRIQRVLRGHLDCWVLFATSGGIWLAVTGAAHAWLRDPNLAQQLVHKVTYDMVGFSLVASAFITSFPWITEYFSGTDGKLYISDEKGGSVQEVDGLSPDALRLPCANYLESAADSLANL